MNTLVIGAGIAGISTATWLRSLNVPFDWVSAGFGGTLNVVYNPIDNHPPGLYANGAELASQLLAYCNLLALRPRQATVSAVHATTDALVATIELTQQNYTNVVLASGTAPRQWNIPGIDNIQRLLRWSSTRNPTEFQRRPVAVIGGGDGAAEAALRLAQHCDVHLVTRSNLRARPHFQELVQSHPNVHVFENCPVTRAEAHPQGCRLHTADGPIDVAAVYIKIGFAPTLPALPDHLKTDSEGFILVDPQGQTSISGLFAAGDVTHCALRSVATSAADGARCARKIADLYESITSSTR